MYNQNLIVKVASVLGSVALSVVMGVPAIAQSNGSAAPSASDTGLSKEEQSRPELTRDSSMPDRDAINPSPTNPRDGIGQSSTSPSSDRPSGPSTMGEGMPGPSETPSGSPSVPGVSGADDPGIDVPGNRPETRPGVSRDSSMPRSMPGSMPERNTPDSGSEGPSAVPGEGYPGPSETPSGSPSVPGVSGADDPGINQK